MPSLKAIVKWVVPLSVCFSVIVVAVPLAFVHAQAAAPACPADLQDFLGGLDSFAVQLNAFAQNQTDSSAVSPLNSAFQELYAAAESRVAETGCVMSSGGNALASASASNDVSAISFPVTVVVTASLLNVRSAPETSAPLAGSQMLYSGNEFMAVNEVQGQSVNGNDLWWVSSQGNYVWSGGTTDTAVNGVTEQLKDTKGNSYPVTFTYLSNGQVQAEFSFTYPNKNSWTQNLSIAFPDVAHGTNQYIISYPFSQYPQLVMANGSLYTFNASNDCDNFEGAAGCIEFDPDFDALIAAIKASAPSNYVSAPVQSTTAQQNSISTTTILTALSQLQAATSFEGAMAIAQAAGLVVTPWSSSDGFEGALVVSPTTGETLASIGQWIDSFDIATSSPTSFISKFSPMTVSALSTPLISSLDSVQNIFTGIIPNVSAAGATAVGIGNTSGQSAECSVAGANGAAGVLVWPNGQIFGGGAGSYTYSFACKTNDSFCSTAQTAASAAQNFLNTLSTSNGTPQLISGSQGSSNNIQAVTIDLTGGFSPAIAFAVQTLQPDGSLSNMCTANLGEQNLVPIFNTSLGLQLNSEQAQQYLTNVVTHEILHCMGLAHVTGDPSNIMQADGPATMQWATSPPSLNEAQINILKTIATGGTIPVQNCKVSCTAGQGAVNAFVGNTCTDQYILCPDSTLLWNEQTQSCQTCQQLGYPSDWVADQSLGICAQVDDSGGVVPDPESPTPNDYCPVGMQWDESTNQCVASESITSNICFTLENGTVQCDCDNGYVQIGNSCVPEGGYYCADDGSCAYTSNPSDVQYTDPSCDNACGDN